MPRCDATDCTNEGTIEFQLDLDPGDAETGPRPDIFNLIACSDDCRDDITEGMGL